MFELILNAAKIAFSKDARDGTNALIDALVKSPDWERDICTFGAKLPADESERTSLLIDVVSEKLSSMSFGPDAISAFRNSSRELITNAVEHGCKDQPKSRIGISVELSPTYVATTISNPKSSPVDYRDAAKNALLRLRASDNSTRGRGIQLVNRLADVVQQTDNYSIKSVIYRERVEIAHHAVGDHDVITVVRGYANPSLYRRLTYQLDEGKFASVVLCLDPRELNSFSELKGLASKLGVEFHDKQNRHIEYDYHDEVDSKFPVEMIDFFTMKKIQFRFVMPDPVFIQLLPAGLAFRSVKEALGSLSQDG